MGLPRKLSFCTWLCLACFCVACMKDDAEIGPYNGGGNGPGTLTGNLPAETTSSNLQGSSGGLLGSGAYSSSLIFNTTNYSGIQVNCNQSSSGNKFIVTGTKAPGSLANAPVVELTFHGQGQPPDGIYPVTSNPNPKAGQVFAIIANAEEMPPGEVAVAFDGTAVVTRDGHKIKVAINQIKLQLISNSETTLYQARGTFFCN